MEILADRLTWEQTGLGIRVTIPPRRDWTVPFFLVWIVGWSIAGVNVFQKTFHSADPQLFDMVWLIGWAFGEAFAAGSIVWALAGCTLLSLDPSRIEVSRLVAGIPITRWSYATSEVRNLRFQPTSGSGRSRTASAIKFEAADKTRSFAGGISDAEALALIDTMLEIYPFPKERAMEYMDLGS